MAHQAVLQCVIDAVIHGDDLSGLAPDLQAVLTDSGHAPGVRRQAAAAWLKCIGYDGTVTVSMLDAIQRGDVDDEEDEITGQILMDAFPQHLTAETALRYLRDKKAANLIGSYHMFWASRFVKNIPDVQLISALEALQKIVRCHTVDVGEFRPTFAEEVAEISHRLLLRALERIGDNASDEQLYQWLGLRLSKNGSVDYFSADQNRIDGWLAARPKRMKAVLACGIRSLEDAEEGRAAFWRIEQRLHRAQRPRDWYRWLLELASTSGNLEIVERWVSRAAHVASHPEDSFDIDLDDVWDWALENATHFPAAMAWVEKSTSYPLDDWRSDDHQRRKKFAQEKLNEQSARRALLLPQLPLIYEGTADAVWMGQISLVYRKQFHGITDEGPLERVANYLGGTAEEAQRAVQGIYAALARSDLPTIVEIKTAPGNGKRLWLSHVCLLAAELLFEQDPNVVMLWSPSVLEALVGFRVIDEKGAKVAWFQALCARLRTSAHRGHPFQRNADSVSDERGHHFRLNADSVSI